MKNLGSYVDDPVVDSGPSALPCRAASCPLRGTATPKRRTTLEAVWAFRKHLGMIISSAVFTTDRNTPTVRDLPTPRDFVAGTQLSSTCSQLLFLRGYPSAEWLRTLGAEFRVDPEFWRRHLHLLHNPRSPHDLPTLPSESHGIIQLRVNTIFSIRDAVSSATVDKSRADGIYNVRDHHIRLEKRRSVGESIIRQLRAHSESCFTLEQQISCCFVTRNGGWAGT